MVPAPHLMAPHGAVCCVKARIRLRPRRRATVEGGGAQAVVSSG